MAGVIVGITATEDTMTDLTSPLPITIRRFAIRLPALPALGVIPALSRFGAAIGAAFKLAYVDPFQPRRAAEKAPIRASEEELEGRDPNW